MLEEFEKGIFLKATDEESAKITGSVRAFPKGGRVLVSKLMVHPDFQNRGIAKKLLAEVENIFTGKEYYLFTALKSEKNIALYTKIGYKRYGTKLMPDGIEIVFMEKK